MNLRLTHSSVGARRERPLGNVSPEDASARRNRPAPFPNATRRFLHPSKLACLIAPFVFACGSSHPASVEPAPSEDGGTRAEAGASSGGGDSTTCTPCAPSESPALDAGTESASETGEPADAGPDAGAEVSPSEVIWRQAEPLFSDSSISQVALTLDYEQESALRNDPRAYVHGDIEVRLSDATVFTLADVGVRLKGMWGSARNLDQKAGFLIKTNEFVPGQKLLGLSKFALNNMVQDPSMIHEQLAYLVFREMGIAAPRTGYATVSLNEQPYGLYATIEVVDNESFLDHWYGGDAGNLYEGAYGSDLESGRLDSFDQDRGQDVAFADLYALAAALDAVAEPSSFMTALGPHVDTDWFARFTATELMLAHWDGYAVTRNNYFLYPNQAAAWTFIPWGLDQTFGDASYSVWLGDARVHRMCTRSQDCRNAMAAAYNRLMGLFTELDLLGRVDALEALIHDAADADPRKEYGSDSIWEAIEATRQFLRDRPANVAEQLVCADPATVDLDGDGASGCGEDCDDGNADVYPAAAEACNMLDDNCNGEVDESDECPSCYEAESNGRRYAFCFHRQSFSYAEADCVAQGGALVAIHSEGDQDEIVALAAERGFAGDFWLGFTDDGYEGQFAWVDGSDVDYSNWGGGEPNDAGGNEDCTQITGSGAWNDLDCDAQLPYVCALP